VLDRIVAYVTLRVDTGLGGEDGSMSEQRTALVLGGGITGIAWEIAGLLEAGST
jgi:hypothetical protein